MSEKRTYMDEKKRPDSRVPTFDPDDRLMADAEGSKAAVRAYRREADVMRRETSKK